MAPSPNQNQNQNPNPNQNQGQGQGQGRGPNAARALRSSLQVKEVGIEAEEAEGGVSIGTDDLAGTLTVIASGSFYSAGHVLTDDRRLPSGSPIFWPSPLDSPSPKLLGYLEGWYLDEEHDIAVGGLAAADVRPLYVKGYGKVSIAGPEWEEEGTSFYQAGRSREGRGKILAADALAKVEGYPWGECVFSGYLTTPLGTLGDSGAPLVDDEGRLFAYVVGTGDDFQVALPFTGEVSAMDGSPRREDRA